MIQLHKSSRLFSCSSCVHKRFISTYTDLYDKSNKIIQAQNTTMKRPTGNITDDIHVDVDIANTSHASSSIGDNQETALIQSSSLVHSHIVSPTPSLHPSPPPNHHLLLINPPPLYQLPSFNTSPHKPVQPHHSTRTCTYPQCQNRKLTN